MSISLISRSVSDFGNTFTKKMELEKKNINKRRLKTLGIIKEMNLS